MRGGADSLPRRTRLGPRDETFLAGEAVPAGRGPDPAQPDAPGVNFAWLGRCSTRACAGDTVVSERPRPLPSRPSLDADSKGEGEESEESDRRPAIRGTTTVLEG